MLKALELEPLSANINLEVGEYYYRNNQNLEKAKTLLEKAVEIQPNRLDAYLVLADYYNFVENQIDQGFVLMHKAYDRVQKKSTALDRIYFPAVDLNIDPYAQQWLNYLQKNFPDSGKRFFNETYFLTKQKKYNAAIENIEKLEKEIEPLGPWRYIYTTAVPFMLSGRDEELIKIIRERAPFLLESDSTWPENSWERLHLYAAAALKRTGNRQQSNQILEKLISHIESNDPEKKYLEWRSGKWMVYNAAKALLGDKSFALNYLEERKRRGHVVNHWIVFDVDNELYYNLPKEVIEPYREAELEIIREQRRNVIDYLKEQGEWNDKWNEELSDA